MKIQLKKEKISLSASAVVSLGLHLLILFFLFHEKVTKEFITSASQNASASKKVNFDLTKVKRISKRELDFLKKQIVASDQTGRKLKPVNSRFSGAADQSFDRQTIARNDGAYKEAGLGNSKLEKNTEKVAAHEPKKKSKKELTLKDLGGINLNTQLAAHEEKELDEEMQKHMQKSDGQGVQNGNRASRGLASSSDFVEDVALGDVTNLNTIENKYYGFYHRIRQKLEQYWGSTIHERAKSLYKKGRRLPASENLITAITVILNESGNIVDIQIEGTSGVKELDQAAVESFNKAGPFPNPPKGLLVDGRAVIQWGFVVKS